MAMATEMTTALAGMKAAQAQVQIAGRNIANVDTVGYTRKYAETKSLVLAGKGSGVYLSDTLRRVDEGLLRSFLASNSTSSSLNAQSYYLEKTDILLGSPIGENSIAATVSNLQANFDNFALDVTQASGRFTLLNSADTLAVRMNYLTQEIQKLRSDADLKISNDVKTINHLLDEIDHLNEEIVKYTVLGYDGVADLQDKRDTALRNLSEKIDISYFVRDNSEIVIQTRDGVRLLDNDPHYLSHNAVTQSNALTSYATGSIAGIYVDGKDITGQILNGEIYGLLQIRDNILPSLQSQLDELAYTLKENINQVHNRGTAYPQTPYYLEGTRSFLSPSTQSVSFSGGDVRFTIFDNNGREVSTASLIGDLGFTSGTVDQLATTMQTWMNSPTGANLPNAQVSVDPISGRFIIETGDSNFTFSVMDEVSATPGSGQQDIQVQFDGNGDGIYDRSFEGFSSFFGFNNFFEMALPNEYVYDSRVLSKSINLGLTTQTSVTFSDARNGMDYASITIGPNDSVTDIVNRINGDPVLSQNMVASLVPNGDGYILRIMNNSGDQLEIAENPGINPYTGVLQKLGIAPSKATSAGEIMVREDLRLSPGLICGGTPNFNFSSGEYELDSSKNNVANDMARLFSQALTFDQSGTIARTQTTLSNYASTFVGVLASQANSAAVNAEYQAELTNSISMKEAEVSGVDMDEELGNLIMFQQTYAACAQAFTVSKEMLDMLLNMV